MYINIDFLKFSWKVLKTCKLLTTIDLSNLVKLFSLVGGERRYYCDFDGLFIKESSPLDGLKAYRELGIWVYSFLTSN
jgi:hypothetical protein